MQKSKTSEEEIQPVDEEPMNGQHGDKKTNGDHTNGDHTNAYVRRLNGIMAGIVSDTNSKANYGGLASKVFRM